MHFEDYEEEHGNPTQYLQFLNILEKKILLIAV